MNRRLPSNFGAGVASILLIVVVLCMTVFATLSLITAKNDALLTQKTIDSARAYYAADARAQRLLADTALALKTGGELPDGVERSGEALSFSVSVGDTTELRVNMLVDGKAYAVTNYGIRATNEETITDDTLKLWQYERIEIQ